MYQQALRFFLLLTLATPTYPNGSNPESGKSLSQSSADAKVKVLDIIEFIGQPKFTTNELTAPDVEIPLTFEEKVGCKLKITKLEATQFYALSVGWIPPNLFLPPIADNKEKDNSNEGQDQNSECVNDSASSNSSCTFQLDPYRTKLIFLRARFQKEGTYSATIRTEYSKSNSTVNDKCEESPNGSISWVVAGTRKLADPPVEISFPRAQQFDSLESKTPPFEVKFYGTGKPVSIKPPKILSSFFEEKPDIQSEISSTLSLELIDDITSSAKDQNCIPLDIKAPIILNNLSCLTGSAVWTGINQPGIYKAKVRFETEGYKSVDQDITLYVRRSVWSAFGFVFVGVLLSLALNAYSVSIRPRWLIQQRVADLQLQLADASKFADDDIEKELLSAVNQAMQTKLEKSFLNHTVITNEFDAYDIVVPATIKWLELRNKLQKIRPVSLVEDLMPKLDEIQNTLLNDSSDLATLQGVLKTLNEQPETIRKAIEESLKKGIKELESELASYSNQTVVQLLTSLQNVSAKVFSGKMLTSEELAAAVGAFDHVHLRYIHFLALELQERVKAPGGQPEIPLPLGFTHDDWHQLQLDITQLVDKIRSEVNLENARAALNEATKIYLFHYQAAIGREVNNFPEPKQTELRNVLNDLREAIKDNQFKNAWSMLEKVKSLIEDEIPNADMAVDLGLPAMGMLGQDALSPTFNLVDTISMLLTWNSIPDSKRQGGFPEKLTYMDFFASLIVLIVMTVVIVKAVWVSNQTWGGVSDCLVAFVSGFIADQFSYAGLKTLVDRILPR